MRILIFPDISKTVATSAMRLSDDLVELEIEKLKTLFHACDTKDEKALWKFALRLHVLTEGEQGLGTHGWRMLSRALI